MPIAPNLVVFDAAVHQFLNTDFEVKTLDSTCRFSEGPVWNPDGFYLFSDIPANVIYKIAEGQEKTVYLQQSGWTPGNTRALHEQIGSNGLAYDPAGNLLVCQHGNGAVALYDGTSLRPYITAFNGRPFNSPNDIIAHPDGTVFFSDPPYGLKGQTLNPAQGQDNACVYCWRDGVLKIVTDVYQYPNGVCLSPDKKTLYTCSHKPFEAHVLAWDVETLQQKREVAAHIGDGIKCDRFGNLYVCYTEGVLILDADGKRLGLIRLDTPPANCCWGGPADTDLLITARQYIFLISGLQRV